MKKSMILLSLISLLAFAGNALAATQLTSSGTNLNGTGETIYGVAGAGVTTGGTVLGRLSKGVQIGVNYTNAGYALTTKHKTGSKRYGTAFNSTAIYNLESSTGADVVAPTSADQGAFAAAGWTAM